MILQTAKISKKPVKTMSTITTHLVNGNTLVMKAMDGAGTRITLTSIGNGIMLPEGGLCVRSIRPGGRDHAQRGPQAAENMQGPTIETSGRTPAISMVQSITGTFATRGVTGRILIARTAEA